ncbi:MAG: HAD family hydrolase [Turicibacter sp.]|nr:HAD family hydrolase [Turicibacter sp.]
MLKGHDAIIFDLDGTLWDPTKTCRDSWNEVILRQKAPTPLIKDEDLYRVFGLKFDKIAAILFASLPKEHQGQLLKDCVDYENDFIIQHGGQLYVPLEKVLGRLAKDYRLFIVSNCQAGYIESFLQHYGLNSYFEDSECPGNTGLEKGENIRLIIERNLLQNPVYVGDTEGDRLAAQMNKIPFIFAAYGFGEVSGYDFSIDSLERLV